MKDETILRMLQETVKGLEGVSFPVTTPHLAPSYNALLAAAKANHPNHPFLSALADIPARDPNGRREDHIGPDEMRILFGQLAIVLESLAGGDRERDQRAQREPEYAPRPADLDR